MPLDFGITEFDPNNGAKGIIPVTPNEWQKVGIDSDVKAFNLINYLYKSFQNDVCFLSPVYVRVAKSIRMT